MNTENLIKRYSIPMSNTLNDSTKIVKRYIRREKTELEISLVKNTEREGKVLERSQWR